MNFRLLRLGLLPLALGTACFLGGNPSQTDGGPPPVDGGGVLPFQADSPFVYVGKVKNILTGLPASQAEVDSVVNAPDDASKKAALVALIDQWMALPEYTSKMQTFFQLAFQQTQITETDFTEIVPNGNGSIGLSPYASLLVQNVKESFARTVLELISEGQPLSSAFTTTRFMMTPALAELYAYMDWNQVDDNEKITDKFAAMMKGLGKGVTVEDTTPVDYASQTIKQGDANFMVWYYPGLNTIQPLGPNNPSGCQVDSRDWISTNFNNVPSAHLVHYLLYGGLEAYKINNGPPPNNNCNAFQSQNQNAVFQQSDFTTWKMVDVRAPKSGEPITPFWDVPTLRSASELVLNIPRVGFFSTPAFHANWQTNTSNQMRVTVNQAFIVALGAQVDGTDTTPLSMIPQPPPGLDQAHTSSGDACVSCHQVLDPSRSIMMASWSDAYGIQTSSSQTKGEFIFNGVVQPVNNLTDFGTQLWKHSLFPDAWIQKLCFFANSQKCDPTDPEFAAIRQDFVSSGYKWKNLVEDVMSSPMTTNAVATTTTTTEGEMISVSRRDHLCTLLNARLGLTDVCGLDVVTTKSLVGVPEIAAGLPSDGYGRGASVPVLPTQPTLFYRSGLENICENVANMVIDAKSPPAGATTYSSTNVSAAIADFVSNIMGIAADDPRSAPMTQMLTDHDTQAIANKASASDALKSTFVTACLSPTVAGIGM